MIWNGTDVTTIKVKCTINVMHFYHSETISDSTWWKYGFPQNQSLVPKRLGTAAGWSTSLTALQRITGRLGRPGIVSSGASHYITRSQGLWKNKLLPRWKMDALGSRVSCQWSEGRSRFLIKARSQGVLPGLPDQKGTGGCAEPPLAAHLAFASRCLWAGSPIPAPLPSVPPNLGASQF